MDYSINKNLLLMFVLVTLCLLPVPAMADFDWDDSEEFSLELVTVMSSFSWSDSPLFLLDMVSETRSFAWSSSGSFNVSLLNMNRSWGESDEFTFYWNANCEPVYGPVRPPVTVPNNSLLRQYNNGWWVEPLNYPSDGDIVFVLNHGWNDSPDGDLYADNEPDNDMRDMAEKIAAKVPNCYIYSWAWGKGPDVKSDANPNGMSAIDDFLTIATCTAPKNFYSCYIGDDILFTDVTKTVANARTHGGRLGDALFENGIRPDVHKIHMIGHSFGGLVSSEAAKVLHQKTGGHEVQQLTTLDTPAIWPDAVSEIDSSVFQRVEIFYYNWHTHLVPRGATGGPLGEYDEHLLNMKLLPSHYPISTTPLHSHSISWYIESINQANDCDDEPYGFGWSFALEPTYDPTASSLPHGLYYENALGKGCKNIPEVPDVIETAARIIQVENIVFDSASQWVGNNAVVALDNVGGVVNSAVKLSLSTGLSGTEMSKSMAMSAPESGPPADPNEAYIYQELEIPYDAEFMTFDFRFVSVVPGDLLTLSIEDDLLVVVDATVEGEKEYYTQSFPVNIRSYAGQTVLLQIALRTSGGTESEVFVDNLKFTKLTIKGDLDGDRQVDMTDLMTLCQQWLDVPGDPSADIAPAPDGDHIVDLEDFAVIAENWGVVIGEPNSL